MPKYGSLYTPFSTSTAKTVLGAEVEYQPSVEKPAAEICSGEADTFAEDCTFQPSRRTAPSSASKTDRKSTRPNSSHLVISYAVFCLQKKSILLGCYVSMRCGLDQYHATDSPTVN